MSNCAESEEDFNELCQLEIKESLHQLHHKESIVLILNSELLMINAVPKRVIKRVAESKICFQIMANTDWKAYGVNILGSKEALLQSLHSIKAQCLKITEKVSLNIASVARFIYILNGQKCNKMQKKWQAFKNLNFGSNSVTRQVRQN